MLLLGSRTLTIEGITVFPDHADPDQFWCLPGPVRLARRKDGRGAFTFIKYKPAAVAEGAKGGGFLTFEVDLRLDKELERRILSRLRSVAPGRPRLAVVPFDEGTVQCVALNLQGSGGTSAQPAPPGAFHAVEQILGASVPSLQGENTAVFSLTLSQEGATILERAFEQGTEPVGVIYDLKFTGMRPALKVEISADMERVYQQFSTSLDAQVYFLRAGIEAGFEKLVEEGAIVIKVLDFTGEEDEREKERWALDFFKENILARWFTPTLTPGEMSGGGAEAASLTEVMALANQLRPPTTPAPPRPSVEAPPPPPPPPPAPTAGTGQGDEEDGLQPPAEAVEEGAVPTENTGFPARSETPPPAAATGVQVARRGGNLPAGLGGGGGGASPALVSFQLKAIRQEERKTIKVVYDRSEATQRTYAPQGFFGLLVADLARADHFVEVDLDSPFFRVFKVSVEAPLDFAAIGLRSAQVALDYGDPEDAAAVKHADFVFDGSSPGPQEFEVFLNEDLDTSYRYELQYHFDPQSDWQGSDFSVEVPPARTEDRTLLLNPFEHVSFLEVAVAATRVDWGVVDSIDVHLAHDGGGEVVEKVITLTAEAATQPWKVRTARGARDYSYRLVHHLKDGSVRETEGATSRASLLPVDDPFPAALELDLVPLFGAEVRRAFVDLHYDDEANGYHRQERLTFSADDLAERRLVIAQMDPGLKTYRYRVTVVGSDNSMRRGAFVETTETLLGLTEPAA